MFSYQSVLNKSSTLAGLCHIALHDDSNEHSEIMQLTNKNMMAFILECHANANRATPLVKSLLQRRRAPNVLKTSLLLGAPQFARPLLALSDVMSVPGVLPEPQVVAVTISHVPVDTYTHLEQGLMPLFGLFACTDAARVMRLFDVEQLEQRKRPALGAQSGADFIDSMAADSDDGDDDDDNDDDDVDDGNDTSSDDFVVGDDASLHIVADANSAVERIAPVCIGLETPFDGRIELYESGPVTLSDGRVVEADHTYVVDGIDTSYISTTTLLHNFFEPFDPPVVATRMVNSPKWPKSEYYNDTMRAALVQHAATIDGAEPSILSPRIPASAVDLASQGNISIDTALDMIKAYTSDDDYAKFVQQLRATCIDIIQQTWKDRAQHGTDMHALLEDFFNGKIDCVDVSLPELRQFASWCQEWLLLRGLVPVRMELRVFDENLGMCGTVDALFYHPARREYVKVDWKFIKKLWRVGFGGKMAKGPLRSLPDCNLSKYQMQLNLYRRMVEDHSDVRIAEMYLVIFHSNQETFHVEPIEVRDDLVDLVYNVRKEQLKEKH